MCGRRAHDRADLIDGVRLDRLQLDARWTGERGDVPRDVTPPVRLTQRGADRAMDLVRPARTTAIGDDLAIEPFQILGFEPVQAMLADLRDQMPPMT